MRAAVVKPVPEYFFDDLIDGLVVADHSQGTLPANLAQSPQLSHRSRFTRMPVPVSSIACLLQAVTQRPHWSQSTSLWASWRRVCWDSGLEHHRQVRTAFQKDGRPDARAVRTKRWVFENAPREPVLRASLHVWLIGVVEHRIRVQLAVAHMLFRRLPHMHCSVRLMILVL